MIRKAEPGDIPALVEMGRRFHEAKQDDYEFVAEDTARFFAGVIEGGVCFIAEDGFLAGAIAPAPSNASYLTAYELFWWSEGRSGVRLRRAFESWAQEHGAADVKFSHPEGEETVARIMDRAGYEPSEKVWRRKCA